MRLAALPLLLAAGCLVPRNDDQAAVRIAIDAATLGLPAETLPGERDADGLLHLDRVPAYLHLVVSGPGIEPPLVAAWPEEGALTPRAEISLQIDVPVGRQRRFALLAYVLDRRTGSLRAWTDDGSLVRDLLEGGIASDLEVILQPLPRGSVRLTLDPPTAPYAAVLLVDGFPDDEHPQGPGVALPRAEWADGHATLPEVPVGRDLALVLVAPDGSTRRSPSPTVRLDAAGEHRDLSVSAP